MATVLRTMESRLLSLRRPRRKRPNSRESKPTVDDDVTVGSTATPLSVHSHKSSSSRPSTVVSQYPSSCNGNSKLRVINLAKNCVSCDTLNRPGVEEDDHELALPPGKNVPPHVAFFPPQLENLTTEKCHIVHDPLNETKRKEMLRFRNRRNDTVKQAMYELERGSMAMGQDRYEAAISSLEEASHLFRIVQKPVPLAKCLDLLGRACSNTGRWDEGLSALYEALMIREEQLGPRHLDTVNTLHHVGKIFMCSGNVTAAADCFGEVFSAKKSILGPNHTTVANVAHDLGIAYDAENDYEQARSFYLTAFKIYRRLGVDIAILEDVLQDLRSVETN